MIYERKTGKGERYAIVAVDGGWINIYGHGDTKRDALRAALEKDEFPVEDLFEGAIKFYPCEVDADEMIRANPKALAFPDLVVSADGWLETRRT
jgi:hypothetical protein